MRKCKGCRYEKIRLQCLICEQKSERSYRHVRPEVVSPVKKMHLELTLVERIVWTTVRAGTVAKIELGRVLHKHPATIWRIYRSACQKLRQ